MKYQWVLGRGLQCAPNMKGIATFLGFHSWYEKDVTMCPEYEGDCDVRKLVKPENTCVTMCPEYEGDCDAHSFLVAPQTKCYNVPRI